MTHPRPTIANLLISLAVNLLDGIGCLFPVAAGFLAYLWWKS